jgi:HK97 family phage major capsid protein
MSTTQVKALFEQRSHAANELRSMYDAAGDAELTAEQTQTEERLNSAITAADERISALLTLSAGEERAAEAFTSLGAEERRDETPVVSDADKLRSIARGEARSAEFFSDEFRGTAAQVKGTAGVGGNTVPTSFYDTLVESMIDVSSVLAANATVIRTAGGEKIQVPTATAYQQAALVTEGTPIGRQDITFGQTDLDAFKYAFVMQASSELVDDTGVNIVELFARRGGEALGNALGAAFINGTGSAQPRGILAASGGIATQGARPTSVANGFNYDDVLTLVHSVLRPYRNGGVFIANDSVVAQLRRLREGTGTGQYLWQPSLTAGSPDTLAGYPVLTDPAMPTAQTNGTKGLVFGNINKAVIVRFAGPVRVESSTDFAFDTDFTTWRFIVRADSEVVDVNAAKALTYAT